MSGPRKHNLKLIAKCSEYIAKTRSLPEAQALAKKDGFSANTSVWLSAANQGLKSGKFPWETS